MSEEHLGVYLNDHLSGSVAAIELLGRIETAYGSSDRAAVVAELLAEVSVDRAQLEGLMERAGISKSAPRRAVGWLTDKLIELKTRLDDRSDGALRLLESIETVAVGIDGKRALWEALAVAAETTPVLLQLDLAHLTQRAREQRRRIEVLRLEAAEAALGGTARDAAPATTGADDGINEPRR